MTNEIKELIKRASERFKSLFRGFYCSNDAGKEMIRVGDCYYTGQWIYWSEYGVLLQTPEFDEVYTVSECGPGLVPETICRFVKLDDNGEPIFEHDKVQVDYEVYSCGAPITETEIKEVIYDRENCGWVPMAWSESCEDCDYYTQVQHLRKVGSVYDVEGKE